MFWFCRFYFVGDAILIIEGRSVSLLNTEGKEIGKAGGYKVTELSSLKEGETLLVGGKEIEVNKVYLDLGCC